MSIFPGSASVGQQFTTASNIVYTFNGESWTISSTKGILIVTSSTRPGSPQEGQLIYETDTDLVLVWNGTEWAEISGGGGTVLFQNEQPDVTDLEVGAIWVDSNEDVGTGLDIQTFLRWSKVLAASATTISGYDDNSLSLLYTPGFEQVYINGTLINRGVDYTASTGNTVVLSEAASAGDLIEIHAFESFGIADVYTKNESDIRFLLNSASSSFEKNIAYSSSSPVSVSTGDLWVDSSGPNPMMKVWNGSEWNSLGSAPVPIITGIAPDNISGTASTAVVINGQNFESGSIAKLIDSSSNELFTLSTTFNNSRSLQILTPTLTASAGPYDIKVTNPDNQISILENALTVGSTPVWSTSAGSLGLIYDSARSSTTFTLLATDADNQSVSYELVSGSLPTGMSLTSGGTISGTAQAVASDTTYAFTIRAKDTSNNFTNRDFSITTKAPIVQSFTTGSTTWTAPVSGNIKVLVVAGGGGGGLQVGGGGGAGGLIYNTSFSVTANQSYAVSIGSGGAGAASSSTHGSNGSNSVFGSLTAIGGGGGGSHSNNGVSTAGGSGGGGGGGNSGGTGGSAGTAGQGNNGGTGVTGSWAGGGGGGAGFAGSNGTPGYGGKGGDGLLIDITGSAVYYAGGGGGCSDGSNAGSSGGLGGGGNGRSNAANGVQNGTANTGGGGGGIRDTGSPGTGGSGIVVVRY